MKLIIDIPDDWKEIYDKGQDMKLAHFIGFKITEGIPLDEVLDKIRAEIDGIEINGQVDIHTSFIRTGENVKQMALDIIDKYTKGESL